MPQQLFGQSACGFLPEEALKVVENVLRFINHVS